MNYEMMPLINVTEKEIQAAREITDKYFELSGLYNAADSAARENILQDMKKLLEKKKHLIENSKNTISFKNILQ